MSRCCNHTTLLFRSYNCFLPSLLLKNCFVEAGRRQTPSILCMQAKQWDQPNEKTVNGRDKWQEEELEILDATSTFTAGSISVFLFQRDKQFANTEFVPSLLQFVWTCWTWSVEVFPLQRRSRRPWCWTGPGGDTQAGTNTVYTFLRMVDTLNKCGSLKIPDQ